MVLNASKPLGDAGIPSLEILVVDDDELNQRMMRVLLTREGHKVETASNGREALEVVKSRRFDIVFMDLHMPVMDGMEASQRIREWERGGVHTFIVALTASYLPEEGQMLFEAGMDNFISKPFEVEHIQKLLKYSSRARLQSVLPGKGAATGKPPGKHMLRALNLHDGIKQVGGEERTYRSLLADFVQELPERIRAIQSYLEADDTEKLSRAAHNLKGVSANLGASQISDVADRLDKLSSGDYTESLREILKELTIAAGIFSAAANDVLNSNQD